MPRVFLIKKNFGNASVPKPKRAREDSPAPMTPQKHQDDSNDYQSNLYIPQDLTPPRTPSSDSIKTPPPGVTLIASRTDLRNNELLSPTISEPLNLNTAASTWPKAMVPPYLPFNFSSLYPAFPQPTASPDYYSQLYPVSLPQRATLPAEQPSYSTARDGSPLKKPEPLTPLPVDVNNSNDNVSSYLYRMWYSRAESNKRESLSSSAPGTPNSDVREETVDLKKRANREAPRYQCSDCTKSYSTMSGLSKHQQFHCVTQAKKSFGCKYCDKVYVSLGALKMHIRTHTLPCKCKLCGKAFSRPWLLQGHVRTHTGEKPFACQHCNRAFADRSNLRAHLQTHSDVKKYSCKSCSKTFSRMSLLLKHEDGGCSGSKDMEGTMMTQVPR